MSQNVQKTIESWYRELGFSRKYDQEFYTALQEIEIPEDISIESYDTSGQDGKRNFLSYLYLCEKLKEKYAEKGISAEILRDTLGDLVIWTDTWSGLKDGLYLGELAWLKYHLSMTLFKLGRLQFGMGKAECDIPAYGVAKGDPVIEIHVPAVGPLTNEECLRSIEKAKAFFAEYYPDYHYKCFTCHSWLLDTSLKELLGSNSNIIRYQNLFDIVKEDKDDAILRYVFKWNAARENLGGMDCTSEFSRQVKTLALGGRDFFVSYGVLR